MSFTTFDIALFPPPFFFSSVALGQKWNGTKFETPTVSIVTVAIQVGLRIASHLVYPGELKF
jgi:hypothetical protein